MLKIDVSLIDNVEFMLCRYNIARMRNHKDSNKPVRPSKYNGEYHDDFKVPVAREHSEKVDLLLPRFSRGQEVEVLIESELDLGNDAEVICFHEEDYRLARCALGLVSRQWTAVLDRRPINYCRKSKFADRCSEFLHRAALCPDWRGNGLDFDKL